MPRSSSLAVALPLCVPARDALRPVPTGLAANVGGKTHGTRPEDTRVHDPELARHARTKAHVRDHVALGIEIGRDLDQLEAVVADAKHRTLGHEQRDLPALATDPRVVADLLELRHELAVPSFLAHDRPAV